MYKEAVMLLQPTVLPLRVFGVCPSALRRLYIPSSNKVYGIILVVLPMILTYKSSEFFISPNWKTLLTALYHWLTCIQHIVLIVSSFTSSLTLVKFFKIIASTQQSLFNLNIRQPFKPSVVSQVLWLGFMLTPVAFLVIWSAVYGVTVLLAILIFHMVRVGLCCKIRVLLDIMNEKFYLLNWHLQFLNNRQPIVSKYYPDLALKGKSADLKKHQEMFILYSKNCKVLTPEKVRCFNKAHLKLYYAYKTLNDVFSLPLLFLVVVSAFAVAADTYLFLNSSSAITEEAHFPYLVVFMLNHLMSLAIILTYATIIHEKNRTTAVLIHDLLDDERHPAEVIEELEKFSLALVHRRACLSAAGFFEVDLKLVSKIASVLAPIIIFMVQLVQKDP